MCPITARDNSNEPSQGLAHNLFPEKSFFTPKDVAEIFGLSIRTWQGIEARGEGPIRIKVGRSVRYARGDLEAWVRQRSQHSPQDRRLLRP